MVCKICNVDKPETEFYLFQNRNAEPRRRHNCKTCISKRETKRYHKKKGKAIDSIHMIDKHQPIEDRRRGRPAAALSTDVNEETRICGACKKVFPISFYYRIGKCKTLSKRCKTCYNRRELKNGWENMDYRKQPGEWISTEQRDAVFEILRTIGWSYNELNGVWYKIPEDTTQIYKNKLGNWFNLNSKKKRTKHINSGRKKMQFDMEEVMTKHNSGMTYVELAQHYKCCTATIRFRIHNYLKNN